MKKVFTGMIMFCMGILVFSACAVETEESQIGGASVLLADLGPNGNRQAIDNYARFRDQLTPGFTAPLEGTEGSIMIGGFNGSFGSGTNGNVTSRMIDHIETNMMSGPVTSIGGDGVTVTRGIIERNGRKFTGYTVRSDVNYGAVPQVAEFVRQANPNAVVYTGQTQGGSRIEMGSNGTANTSHPGYEGESVSPTMGRNYSPVIDENYRNTVGAPIYSPPSVKQFASDVKLPLSNSVDTTGNYLCTAMAATTNGIQQGQNMQLLPGLTVGGVSSSKPNQGTTAFGHVNYNENATEMAPRFVDAAINSVPPSSMGSSSTGTVISSSPPVSGSTTPVPTSPAPTNFNEDTGPLGLH
jgi:hypothetical protein